MAAELNMYHAQLNDYKAGDDTMEPDGHIEIAPDRNGWFVSWKIPC